MLAPLLTIVVVERTGAAPSSFGLLVLPLGLAALSACNLKRAVVRPDESV